MGAVSDSIAMDYPEVAPAPIEVLPLELLSLLFTVDGRQPCPRSLAALGSTSKRLRSQLAPQLFETIYLLHDRSDGGNTSFRAFNRLPLDSIVLQHVRALKATFHPYFTVDMSSTDTIRFFQDAAVMLKRLPDLRLRALHFRCRLNDMRSHTTLANMFLVSQLAVGLRQILPHLEVFELIDQTKGGCHHVLGRDHEMVLQDLDLACLRTLRLPRHWKPANPIVFNAPAITDLDIGCESDLVFSPALVFPHLRRLTMCVEMNDAARPSVESLSPVAFFMKHTSHLTDLTLHEAKSSTYNLLFGIASQLESLRKLEIWEADPIEDDGPLLDPPTGASLPAVRSITVSLGPNYAREPASDIAGRLNILSEMTYDLRSWTVFFSRRPPGYDLQRKESETRPNPQQQAIDMCDVLRHCKLSAALEHVEVSLFATFSHYEYTRRLRAEILRCLSTCFSAGDRRRRSCKRIETNSPSPACRLRINFPSAPAPRDMSDPTGLLDRVLKAQHWFSQVIVTCGAVCRHATREYAEVGRATTTGAISGERSEPGIHMWKRDS